MGIKTTSRTGLFLMEVMIVLTFFSFCSAICMRLMVDAVTLRTDAADLSAAVRYAQSAAEAIDAGYWDDEVAALLGGTAEGGAVTVYYDDAWSQAGQTPSDHTMVIEMTEQDDLRHAVIRVYADDVEIHTITAARWIGGGEVSG